MCVCVYIYIYIYTHIHTHMCMYLCMCIWIVCSVLKKQPHTIDHSLNRWTDWWTLSRKSWTTRVLIASTGSITEAPPLSISAPPLTAAEVVNLHDTLRSQTRTLSLLKFWALNQELPLSWDTLRLECKRLGQRSVCTCAGAVPYEPADARLTHNSGTHGAQHTLLPRHRWLGAFGVYVWERISRW